MASRIRLCQAGLALALAACGHGRAPEETATIVVGGDINHEAVHALEKSRGRHATREELLELHRVWIDNEILYREGLKLPATVGKAASREQVSARALLVIEEAARPGLVSDEELRRWFESRRDKYEQPARFDFEDLALPGQSSEAAVRGVVEQLNNGAPGDAQASLRVFKGRPESNLVQSYGPEVATALAKSQPGRWLPLPARQGWRAMRLVAMTPTAHAAFEAQREAIRRDWNDATAAERRRVAVQALWQKYKIELAPPFECHADK
jgi:hypothetical protein